MKVEQSETFTFTPLHIVLGPPPAPQILIGRQPASTSFKHAETLIDKAIEDLKGALQKLLQTAPPDAGAAVFKKHVVDLPPRDSAAFGDAILGLGVALCELLKLVPPETGNVILKRHRIEIQEV
jgi:hypothetical protein